MTKELFVVPLQPTPWCEPTDEARRIIDEALDACASVSKVTSQMHAKVNAANLKEASNLRRLVKASLDAVIAPALAQVAEAREKAGVYLERLDDAIAKSKRLQADWEFEQMRIRQEEARKAREEADRLERERQALLAKANRESDLDKRREISAEASVIGGLKAQALAAPILRVPKTEAKGVVVVPKWKATVVDAPALYRVRPDLVDLKPSMARINDMLRAGMRECEGLLIEQEMEIKA